MACSITLVLLVLCTPMHLAAQNGNVHNTGSRTSAEPQEYSKLSSRLALNEAIHIGVVQHPLIERAQSASRIAKALTRQARGDQYPWIEASVAQSSGSLRVATSDGKVVHNQGGHGFDLGGALPKHNQNMLTGGLILNQLITDFGYTAHRILANEANEAATEKNILTNKALVILTVQKAYLNCLLQQNLVEIATATLTRRKAVRDQVQTLYRHQLKPKVDLDLILVEVSNAELMLIKAQNDLRQAFAGLNNAMGIHGSDFYELEKISIGSTSIQDPERLVTIGLRDRPELLVGRDRVVASEEMLKAVKALNLGSISAVGVIGVTKYWDTHDNGIHDNQVAPLWGIGATVNLPLFTGFRIANQIKEADHRKGEAERELQNVANEVVLQIIRAYLTQTTNAEQIALERERVTFATEALNLAQERYRLGLGPIIEVVRATTALLEADSSLMEAQYIYKISETAIAYATGQDYKRF